MSLKYLLVMFGLFCSATVAFGGPAHKQPSKSATVRVEIVNGDLAGCTSQESNASQAALDLARQEVERLCKADGYKGTVSIPRSEASTRAEISEVTSEGVQLPDLVFCVAFVREGCR